MVFQKYNIPQLLQVYKRLTLWSNVLLIFPPLWLLVLLITVQGLQYMERGYKKACYLCVFKCHIRSENTIGLFMCLYEASAYIGVYFHYRESWWTHTLYPIPHHGSVFPPTHTSPMSYTHMESHRLTAITSPAWTTTSGTSLASQFHH